MQNEVDIKHKREKKRRKKYQIIKWSAKQNLSTYSVLKLCLPHF